MQILEILNTKIEVKWSQDDHKNLGEFELDGNTHIIHLDEYLFGKKTLVDFGFDTNGKYNAVDSKKSSAKIIGAVINGAVPKIKSINPDFILISVRKSSGLVESRKSLYGTIISWMMKRTSFNFVSPTWVENTDAFYKIIAKEKPLDSELKTFIDTVSNSK